MLSFGAKHSDRVDVAGVFCELASMGPIAVTFGLAALNGFVLTAMIGTAKVNATANRLLAGLVALVSLRLCIYLIGFAGLYDAHPSLTFLPLDVSAAYGPLGYLYVLALTSNLSATWRWHLSPALVQFGYQVVCFLLPMPTKWNWYSGIHLDWVEPIATTAILVQCCAYVAAAWVRHARYQAWLDDRFGNREQWRLGWLRAMLVTFALALAVTLATFAWSAVAGRLDYWGRVPAMLGFAVLAYVLGLLGWRHGAIDFPRQTRSSDGRAAEPVGARPPRVDYAQMVEEWRRRMAAGGWWREERLTVADLAGRLCVSERTLSRGLREGGAGNFNLFVNAFRVKEVLRALEAGSRDDLLGLALASGFASKASFNRAFLAVTGRAPSAWRREAQIPPIDATAVI